MTSAANEFFARAQRARKSIFKRCLIFCLSFLAGGGVVWWLIRPFPLFIFYAVSWVVAAVFIQVPFWRLQKMLCPYCHYPARVGILPFRYFRCMHCHRSLGAEMATNRGA